MDEELRTAAAAALAEMRDRALAEGPDYAAETFDGFHRDLDHNCDALLRRIEERRRVPNPAYHRSFALASKLVLLAARDDGALDGFMGTAGPRRGGTSERLNACENLLRALGDDHEWILVETDAGPSVRGSWEVSPDPGLAGIDDAEEAVTHHLGGPEQLELELATNPALGGMRP